MERKKDYCLAVSLPLKLNLGHSIVSNGFFLIHQTTSLKVKILLVHQCTFKGSPKFYCVGYIIFKAYEVRIDPKEDLSEKEICSPGSCCAAINDGITIYCVGYQNYIDQISAKAKIPAIRKREEGGLNPFKIINRLRIPRLKYFQQPMRQCAAIVAAQEIGGRLLVFKWPPDGSPDKYSDTQLSHRGSLETNLLSTEMATLWVHISPAYSGQKKSLSFFVNCLPLIDWLEYKLSYSFELLIAQTVDFLL